MLELTIAIPSTVNSVQRGATEIVRVEQRYLDKITDKLARYITCKLGGATVTSGNGYYKDNSGQIVKERVRLITSIVFEDEGTARALFHALACDVKELLHQESVLVIERAVDSTLI